MTYNGEHELDNRALRIATEHLLKKKTLKKLEEELGIPQSTLHRRILKWLQEGRFSLVDNTVRAVMARAGEEDHQMGESLVNKAVIRRARVIPIVGAEAAYNEDYREEETGENTQLAYRASDELHYILGEFVSKYISERLRSGITVGIASGRGIGFTTMHIAELAKARPSLFRGMNDITLVPLCGGGRTGTWQMAIGRPLDADENAFHLAETLGVPTQNVRYTTSWISLEPRYRPEPGKSEYIKLNIALVGLGQLNTRHHFFRNPDILQMKAVSDQLNSIKKLQTEDSTIFDAVADIGHHLFLVKTDGVPQELVDAVEEINSALLTMPSDTLYNADEVILVAGGAQKVTALTALVTGKCPGAPINVANLTLVTDSWTANAILKKINGTADEQ